MTDTGLVSRSELLNLVANAIPKDWRFTLAGNKKHYYRPDWDETMVPIIERWVELRPPYDPMQWNCLQYARGLESLVFFQAYSKSRDDWKWPVAFGIIEGVWANVGPHAMNVVVLGWSVYLIEPQTITPDRSEGFYTVADASMGLIHTVEFA